jgi:hypothetical protein
MAKTVQKSKTTKVSKKISQTSKKTFSSKLIKKKPYIEFITAFLSIPVLITIMLLNLNSLKNLNGKPTPTPGIDTAKPGFFTAPIGTEKPSNIGDNSRNPCIKALGPVSIAAPQENDTVTTNPVTVDISYDDSTYCGASWSYRVNDGDWSGYDDRSVALYNLPQGQVKFELRVKSIVTSEQKTLTRGFTYNAKNTVLIPTTPNSSSSAR